MPKLTSEGFRINIARFFDPDSFNTRDHTRCFIAQSDYRVYKDCLVAGDIIICDMGVFKPVHYAKMFDVKHILIINCHPLLQKGITLCKTFVSKKIADRMLMISPKNLTDYVQAKYLPEDFGGTQRSLEYFKEAWIKELTKEEKLLVEIGEAKPTGPIPKELQAYDNKFGIDGSFRKLNID